MRVVQIVAIRSESGSGAKETSLRRHNRDFAARGHLFHPETPFAFAPDIRDQSPVGRDRRDPVGLSVLGHWPNADVAGVNRRTAVAEKLIDSESGCGEQQYDNGRRCEDDTLVAASFGD